MATLAMVHPKFALILGFWCLIFIGVSIIFSKHAKRLSIQAAESSTLMFGHMVDILSNVMNVRLFGQSMGEINHLKQYLNIMVATDQKRDWLFLIMFLIQGISFALYNGTCIFWLMYDVQEGNVTTGDFVLISTINIQVIHSMWNLSEHVGRFANYWGDFEQGLSVVMQPMEIHDKPNAKVLSILQGQIVFDKVQFQYQKKEVLFNDQSVTICPGQKVGLVGYSGSGKSTLAKKIMAYGRKMMFF
jgi:ATP-binding cassette subfamily B protein